MSKRCSHYKIGTLCSVKHGYPFDGNKFDSHGQYVVLTPGNFYEKGGFKRIRGKEKFFSGEFPEGYLCSHNDLIVAMTQQADGLLGSTALVPESGVYLHNQRIGLLSNNPELVDKYYLYYLFMTKGVRKQIADSASGTKIKHTSPEKIYDVDVWVPNVAIQSKNATLLRSIDKRIEINNQVCIELESMAKTLYDYWFTQFDFPDENGKPYRTSGGAMEWNEQLKREIPKGWTADIIGNLLSKTPSTTRIQTSDYLSDGSIPVVDQSSEFIAGYTNENSACLSAPSGYIVFGDHTRIVKYIRFPFARGADGTQILKSKTPCVPEELLYQIVRGVDLSNQGYARHFKFLKDTPTIVPKETVAQNYAEKVRPIHDMQTKLVFENVELTKLRDWLLPMLMNGQATVE